MLDLDELATELNALHVLLKRGDPEIKREDINWDVIIEGCEYRLKHMPPWEFRDRARSLSLEEALDLVKMFPTLPLPDCAEPGLAAKRKALIAAWRVIGGV